jgi:hypothetical protein
VGGGIDAVGEPRPLPDGRRDPEPILLGEDEGLEVVEDDRLVERSESPECEGLQEQCVASDTGSETCDGGRGAAHGPGYLSMGASRDESCGDGQQQFGSFQVVGAGEALQREAASAGGTTVTWDAATGA